MFLRQAPARPVARAAARPVAPSMQGSPRVSSSPGQRFLPQANAMGARMGSIQLAGGVLQQRPFLNQVRLGQQQVRLGQEQVTQTAQPMPGPQPTNGAPNGVPSGAPNGAPNGQKGPSARALERRRAWGQLKKLEAEELAKYLEDIAARMDQLEIPSGILKKYADKLAQFSATAPPGAELQLTDEEIVELDAAIMVYEEAESRQTVKAVTIGAVTIAVVGIGAAILL